MLNKKTLFNGVYALALFGAITSCIGILNELLNLVQFYDRKTDLISHKKEDDFLIPIIYQLVAFILCAFTVIVLILYVTNILKEKHVWIPNVCIVITCGIIFVLSWTLINEVQNVVKINSQNQTFVSSFNYTMLYAFRSVVLSYIASAGTILFCNIIQSIAKKRITENHTDEETQA